jgi:hypothetical protein
LKPHWQHWQPRHHAAASCAMKLQPTPRRASTASSHLWRNGHIAPAAPRPSDPLVLLTGRCVGVARGARFAKAPVVIVGLLAQRQTARPSSWDGDGRVEPGAAWRTAPAAPAAAAGRPGLRAALRSAIDEVQSLTDRVTSRSGDDQLHIDFLVAAKRQQAASGAAPGA